MLWLAREMDLGTDSHEKHFGKMRRVLSYRTDAILNPNGCRSVVSNKRNTQLMRFLLIHKEERGGGESLQAMALLDRGADPTTPVVAYLMERKSLIDKSLFYQNFSIVLEKAIAIGKISDGQMKMNGGGEEEGFVHKIFAEWTHLKNKAHSYSCVNQTEPWFRSLVYEEEEDFTFELLEYVTRHQHTWLLSDLLRMPNILSYRTLDFVLKISCTLHLTQSLRTMMDVLRHKTTPVSDASLLLLNDMDNKIVRVYQNVDSPIGILPHAHNVNIYTDGSASSVFQFQNLHAFLTELLSAYSLRKRSRTEVAALANAGEHSSFLEEVLMSAVTISDISTVVRVLSTTRIEFSSAVLNEALSTLFAISVEIGESRSVNKVDCCYKKAAEALRRAGALWDDDTQLNICKAVRSSFDESIKEEFLRSHKLKALFAYLLKHVTCKAARMELMTFFIEANKSQSVREEDSRSVKLLVMMYDKFSSPERLQLERETHPVISRTWRTRDDIIQDKLRVSHAPPNGKAYLKSMRFFEDFSNIQTR